MTVSDRLIDDISSETGRQLAERARQRRHRALGAVAQYCVTFTEDGRNTREILFSHPPTMRQMTGVLGPEAFVVSVRMHRDRSGVSRRVLAAE